MSSRAIFTLLAIVGLSVPGFTQIVGILDPKKREDEIAEVKRNNLALGQQIAQEEELDDADNLAELAGLIRHVAGFIRHVAGFNNNEFPASVRHQIPEMLDSTPPVEYDYSDDESDHYSQEDYSDDGFDDHLNDFLYPETMSSGVVKSQLKKVDDAPEHKMAEGERCPICLESNGEVVVFSCNHSFHKGCIKEWLENHGNNCPLCRAPIDKMCTSTSTVSATSEEKVEATEEKDSEEDDDGPIKCMCM